jgi:hypothetical protein
MPILTIEAIRENPWNVMNREYELPDNPTRLLLEVAHFAAAYCRDSESFLVHAARELRYVPAWWQPGKESPDIHEDSEAQSDAAERKLQEIGDLYEKICGVILDR